MRSRVFAPRSRRRALTPRRSAARKASRRRRQRLPAKSRRGKASSTVSGDCCARQTLARFAGDWLERAFLEFAQSDAAAAAAAAVAIGAPAADEDEGAAAARRIDELWSEAVRASAIAREQATATAPAFRAESGRLVERDERSPLQRDQVMREEKVNKTTTPNDERRSTSADLQTTPLNCRLFPVLCGVLRIIQRDAAATTGAALSSTRAPPTAVTVATHRS